MPMLMAECKVGLEMNQKMGCQRLQRDGDGVLLGPAALLGALSRQDQQLQGGE